MSELWWLRGSYGKRDKAQWALARRRVAKSALEILLPARIVIARQAYGPFFAAARVSVLLCRAVTMTEPLEPPEIHHVNAAEGWLGLGNASEAEHELGKLPA